MFVSTSKHHGSALAFEHHHSAAILFILALGCTDSPASKSSSSPEVTKKHQFVFDGNEYAIDRAEIVAVLPDPYWCDTYNNGQGKALSWSIRFEAKGREISGDSLSPHVSFDGLNFLKVTDWRDLAGTSITWTEPVNDETGGRYGLTYLYDHQLIINGKLQVKLRDGTVFRIVASGENEEGQKFSINADARFVEVRVNGSEKDNDEQIRERLSKHLSLKHLKPTPFKIESEYDDGTKFGDAIYTPIE